MNLFGIAITYSVCWWLVLFMVLPWGVKMVENPGLGHARSAPAHAHIKRKLLITTLLTIIPTALMYFVVSDALAKEPSIYSTTGATPADPDKHGTYSTKNAGTGCRPANLPGSSAEVPVNVAVPITPYFDASKQGSNSTNTNTDMVNSQGAVGLGQGQVNKDGSLTMNGKKIGGGDNLSECPPEENEAATKAK